MHPALFVLYLAVPAFSAPSALSERTVPVRVVRETILQVHQQDLLDYSKRCRELRSQALMQLDLVPVGVEILLQGMADKGMGDRDTLRSCLKVLDRSLFRKSQFEGMKQEERMEFLDGLMETIGKGLVGNNRSSRLEYIQADRVDNWKGGNNWSSGLLHYIQTYEAKNFFVKDLMKVVSIQEEFERRALPQPKMNQLGMPSMRTVLECVERGDLSKLGELIKDLGWARERFRASEPILDGMIARLKNLQRDFLAPTLGGESHIGLLKAINDIPLGMPSSSDCVTRLNSIGREIQALPAEDVRREILNEFASKAVARLRAEAGDEGQAESGDTRFYAMRALAALHREGSVVAADPQLANDLDVRAERGLAESRQREAQLRLDEQRREARAQAERAMRAARIKPDLVRAGNTFLQAKMQYLALEHELTYETLSQDIPARVQAFKRFVEKEYTPAMSHFGRLASEYVECVGPAKFRDLCILHDWLNRIVF